MTTSHLTKDQESLSRMITSIFLAVQQGRDNPLLIGASDLKMLSEIQARLTNRAKKISSALEE
jgi:hypothetical protein